jgi:hypothetical protein
LDRDIPIQIHVWNTSRQDVFLTVEYMQKNGPYTRFRSLRTGRRWIGDIRLPVDDLIDRYTLIPPDQHISISHILKREELSRHQRGYLVDVEVEFDFLGKWRLQTENRRDFDVTGKIRITEKATP